MIENQLSFSELKSFLQLIIKLEPLSEILPVLGKAFYVENASADAIEHQNKYQITYEGYTLNVGYLRQLKDGVSIIMQFRKPGKWWHQFFNPNKLIVKHLKKICSLEFYNLEFTKYEHFVPATYKDSEYKLLFLHDSNTYNSKWKQGYQVSPLIIAPDNHDGKFFVEFHFNAECYQRINNKTIGKLEWRDHISDVVNAIEEEANRRMGIYRSS